MTTFILGCATYKPIDSNPFFNRMTKVDKKRYKRTLTINLQNYSDTMLQYFRERGYVVIGYTAFRDQFVGIQRAAGAGGEIGATVLLYKHTYVGNASGTAVIPFYIPGDRYTINTQSSGSVSAYGSSNFSTIGNGGYSFGSSQSSLSGSYRSSSTTTITGPGSFSYYTVPYSNDYYDQYAIYMVQKFYYIEEETTIFRKPTKKDPAGTLPKNVWFEVIMKGKNTHMVRVNGRVYFIDGSLPLH